MKRWNEENSIPKWTFAYALMIFTIMSISDTFMVIPWIPK